MTTLTQLRAFHVVAAAGGYSQAARDISISQSTLSGQVRQLETASGVALFERRPRGVTLTAQGEELYKVTSRLFSAVAEAAALLKLPRAEGGRLRVVADGVVHGLPILRRLQTMRPGLTFTFAVKNSDEVIDGLLEHRADVGISAQFPRDERLHVRPLAAMALGVMLPASDPAAGRASLRLADLEGLPFVLRERGSRTRAVFEQNLRAASVTLGPVLEVSSREGVREAVAMGFGGGVTADLEFGSDSRLRYVPLSDAALGIQEYVICLEDRRRLPVVADFLACAAATFARPAPRPDEPARAGPA